MLKRLVSILVLLAIGHPAAAAVVQDARTSRSEEYTRLVFDLDEDALEHKVFTLSNPDRVVIDLIGSRLDDSLDGLELAGTPIASVRSAQRNGTDVRVVLDLKNRVEPRSFLLERSADYAGRLVIDLYDKTSADAAPAPVVSASTSLAAERRDIVVAISAGHGGEDPGAIGVNRLREKNVTLEISREVARLINNTPGYRAVLIRDGDYYVGLRKRIELGHDSNADLYLAIHADAHANTDASGSTIYALSQRGATSEQAQRLADKENSADLIGGVGSVSLTDKDAVLASVLLDLSMTASIATSLEIGDRVIASLGEVVKMRRRNVEQAAFVELKSADIPSLLIESGYITNAKDAKNLDSPAWRERFADALVNSITDWFYERPPPGTLVAWQKNNGGGMPAPGSYTVRSGDSLSKLAERYGIAMADLKRANGIEGNVIQVGQVLVIPGTEAASGGGASSFTEHTIARGETLSQIATSYAVSMDRIRETNQLKSDTIRVGQVLKIPTS